MSNETCIYMCVSVCGLHLYALNIMLSKPNFTTKCKVFEGLINFIH